MNGLRLVAAGTLITWYPEAKVPYPMDFYQLLARESLGKDWFDAEALKGDSDAHPIAMLFKKFIEFTGSVSAKNGPIVSAPRSGPLVAWFILCWDLFIAKHYGLLTKRFIARLKNRDQFQGARYELTIMTLFLRAGFEVIPEDEKDGTSHHSEFLARDRFTKEEIHVEAKSRHRPGVLGYRTYNQPPEPTTQVTAGVDSLLSSALSKNIEGSVIICIDLNLRELSGKIDESPITKEILESIRNRNEIYGLNANALIFTNYPHHYGVPGERDPASSYLYAKDHERNPKISEACFNRIQESLEQYGYFPLTWDELTNS